MGGISLSYIYRKVYVSPSLSAPGVNKLVPLPKVAVYFSKSAQIGMMIDIKKHFSSRPRLHKAKKSTRFVRVGLHMDTNSSYVDSCIRGPVWLCYYAVVQSHPGHHLNHINHIARCPPETAMPQHSTPRPSIIIGYETRFEREALQFDLVINA